MMPDLRAVAASPGVMRWSRRAVRTAAIGGGGIGAAGALGVLGFATFVSAEIARVRRIVRAAPTTPPPKAEGIFGEGDAPPAHSLVLLGDSTAAGLGVHLPEETPGARLATALARLSAGQVTLTVVAAPGADSTRLGEQLDRALPARPDIAVIMVGANDVKNRIRPTESVRHLDETVRRLRDADCEVVVATCPDLGTVQAFSRAGRTLARLWSRRLAAAQTVAVVEGGGRTVSLGDLLGPEFRARPGELFAADHFHPSAAGYAAACGFLEPAIADALGYAVAPDAIPVETTPDAVAGAATVRAAATAVANPGTMVVPEEQPPGAPSRHRLRAAWRRLATSWNSRKGTTQLQREGGLTSVGDSARDTVR